MALSKTTTHDAIESSLKLSKEETEAANKMQAGALKSRKEAPINRAP